MAEGGKPDTYFANNTESDTVRGAPDILMYVHVCVWACMGAWMSLLSLNVGDSLERGNAENAAVR